MRKKCTFGFVSILFLAAALMLAGVSLNAQTVKWVDQGGGSDVNDGNSEATAYASLQYAIDNSTSGVAGTPSTIHVKNGAYQTPGQRSESLYFTGILVDYLDYLTIQAVPGHEPSARPLAGGGLSIAIDYCNHVVIDNIDLDGSLSGFDRMHVRHSSDITLRNSTVEFGVDGIDVETSGNTFLIENNVFRTHAGGECIDFSDGAYDDVTIQDNLFEADNRRPILIRNLGSAPIGNFIIRRNIILGTNDQEAIRLIGVDGVLVENNVIMNSEQQGLYIDTNVSGGSPCSNITVQHNSFFNNDLEYGPNGEIRTKVTSADIIIKNNILYANGTNPIFETTATSLPGEDFNLAFNSPQLPPGSFTFGPNTITGLDPLFVSTTAGSEDLHLQEASPAVEAGTDLGVTDDIEKNTRPDPAGTYPDMGAYELGGPAGCATLLVQVDLHTVGGGNNPGSSKEGIAGMEVCVFDKSEGSCARNYGISWHHYPEIFINCTPVACGTTDAQGSVAIPLEAGDYIVVGKYDDACIPPNAGDTIYIGVSASDFECAPDGNPETVTMRKYLQVIIKANGQKVPAKYTKHTGSELLIIEPEYVLWDDTMQLYPFVFQSVGDWGVTASVAPPEGFVSDHDALSADVDNEVEAVQFTITEVSSELVPTETTFRIEHKGQFKTVHSSVDIRLTPAYAKSRGFDVAALRAQGLIMEGPSQHSKARGSKHSH